MAYWFIYSVICLSLYLFLILAVLIIYNRDRLNHLNHQQKKILSSLDFREFEYHPVIDSYFLWSDTDS